MSSKYDNSQFTDFLAVLIGLSIASLGLLGMVTYNMQGHGGDSRATGEQAILGI
ncbi:hypothetical protein [Spirosoma foliorum]|uniref:Uncharacterized protein n=1 Tax=Spirosoma foliorum TaxID=2710596 RepID=A0A7G5GN77_9BACT|nr:hypothetical protein [Spirosoma foliorum]QMW00319.1 hypothetical protein H3H32_20080 [Spirosoma foliorum]